MWGDTIQPTTLADSEKSLRRMGFLEIHFYHTSQTVFYLPWTLLLGVGPIHPCYLMSLLPVAAFDEEAIPPLPVTELLISPGSVQPHVCWEPIHLPSEQSG